MFQDRARDNPQSMQEFHIIGMGQRRDASTHQAGHQRPVTIPRVAAAKDLAVRIRSLGICQQPARGQRPVATRMGRQDAGEKDQISRQWVPQV